MMPLRTVAVADISDMNETDLDRDFEEAEMPDTEGERDSDRPGSVTTGNGNGSSRGGSGSTRTGSGSTRAGSGSTRGGSGRTRRGSVRPDSGSTRDDSGSVRTGSGYSSRGHGSARGDSAITRGSSASTRASSAMSVDRPSSSESRKTSSGLSIEETAAVPERQVHDGNDKKDKNHPTLWQSFKKAGAELNQDTRKAIRYIGRKLNRRGSRETKVKEIHILPGEDEDHMWARRLAGSRSNSAHSRSSGGSGTKS